MLTSAWQLTLTTLHRYRTVMLVTAALFLGFALAGWRATGTLLSTTQVRDMVREVLLQGPVPIGEWGKVSPLALWLAIAAKNTMAVAITIFGGRISLGLIPLAVVGFNGFLIGAVAAMVTNPPAGLGVPPQSPFQFLAAILPHGVIELPVIWLAAAFGISTGYSAFEGLLRLLRLSPPLEEQDGGVLPHLPSGQVLILCTGWLLVAAAIEAFVTPLVIASVL